MNESIKSLFEQVITFYRRHWRVLSLSAAVPLLPIALLDLVLDGLAASSLGGAILAVSLALFVSLPASLIAWKLAEGLTFVQLFEVNAGRPASLANAWSILRPRFVPLLLTTLLASLSIALGLLLFVLPGLFLIYRLVALTPVVIFEGKAGTEAMFRSSELVTRAKSEFVWVLVAAVMVTFVASSVLGFVLPGALHFCSQPLTAAVTAPLTGLGVSLLYLHVTGRKVLPPLAPPADEVPAE